MAKETLPGFGFFWTSLLKLHVDIFFRGAVDAWCFLYLPPFLFLPASWPNCDLWTRETAFDEAQGQRTNWIMDIACSNCEIPLSYVKTNLFLIFHHSSSSSLGMFYYYGVEMVFFCSSMRATVCVCI